MNHEPTYNRAKLYGEVWADPVTIVAKRYGVSDVAIHKACKRLNVPVPPRGYRSEIVGRAHRQSQKPLLLEDAIQPARESALITAIGSTGVTGRWLDDNALV